MTIPKKQLNLIISLMEAMPLDGTKYSHQHDVYYDPNDEIYYGCFDVPTLHRLQSMHIITIVGEHDNEEQAIKINHRLDFLTSFESGVTEARNGNDLYYADYASHQYAFTCGFEHYQNRLKKEGRNVAYNIDKEYVCHGFNCTEHNDIWKQP
ncbi:hypothetical protein [Photobacterium leiognathi]|uniref:hypothetical protein n=1 Tax=Photobacterium leiognathi TaxID=553611 RepID=UPI0029814A06|nr:hypothetical protein [Photobacterium leiognathi]